MDKGLIAKVDLHIEYLLSKPFLQETRLKAVLAA